jgi:glutamate synthase domain-containing protein 2
MRNLLIFGSLIILLGLIALGKLYDYVFFIAALIFLPVVLLIIYDAFQSKHAILRNFPLVGRSRYMAEWLRPKLYQYFVESDYDGRPFSRLLRNTIYQRAKNVMDTTPFGTQLDVYAEGYEWMEHSINPVHHEQGVPHYTVKIGGKDCTQPYDLSIFNVSAMSYGSLSSAAIEALNGGAAKGNFAHNTGEGGISPYHLKHKGDLIYQVGTGYFGCRAKDGNFDPELFKKRCEEPSVKMIEIKLSQGAKPGHGGILPAKKATPEIAKIRNIEPYKDVLSPPYHRAFSTPTGLIKFIGKCRELSGGKPVGFKLCVGQKSEFLAICKAMIETGIKPDFISVDGGEGGTGAAPLEFSDSVGMPYKEGLAFVFDTLIGFGIKKEIKIIAAGKIVSGFHIFRAIALGADACYSARAMMMAVGCIQALECNQNTCPTGVATQDQKLIKGLVVADKKERVYEFHKDTVTAFGELLAASGMHDPDEINRYHVNRRIIMNQSQRYVDIYPYLIEGCLLNSSSVPPKFKTEWNIADPHSFKPKFESVYIEEDN